MSRSSCGKFKKGNDFFFVSCIFSYFLIAQSNTKGRISASNVTKLDSFTPMVRSLANVKKFLHVSRMVVCIAPAIELISTTVSTLEVSSMMDPRMVVGARSNPIGNEPRAELRNSFEAPNVDNPDAKQLLDGCKATRINVNPNLTMPTLATSYSQTKVANASTPLSRALRLQTTSKVQRSKHPSNDFAQNHTSQSSRE